MTGKLGLNCLDPLSPAASSSSSSSSSSPTLVLRQRKEEANQRFDMRFSDIIDADIHAKIQALFPSYTTYPLLYLIYVLVRNDRMLDETRDFLRNTRRNWARNLSFTYITNIEDVKDDEIRHKIEEVRKIAPETTTWWALYALQVCDGDTDCALSLLFEGIVNVTQDPLIRVASVSTSPVNSPIRPRSKPDLLGGLSRNSPSDPDSPMLCFTTPNLKIGNESSQTSLPQTQPSPQSPKGSFISISDDEEDFDAEDTTTLSTSPDPTKIRVTPVDKGKGVDRSDLADYNSDIDMNGVPSFPQTNTYDKQDSACKYCRRIPGESHEFSCRNGKRVCYKCKGQFCRSGIRRHERRCDGRQTSRRDGSEFEERDTFMQTQARPSVSRGRSPDLDSEPPTEEQLQKAQRMRHFLPHLSVDECIESLKLCDGNIGEAINVEMEVSTSGDENNARGSCSQQGNSLKRKYGSTSDEPTTKKARTQIDDGEPVLEAASQWVKTTFLDVYQNSTNLTLVHLSCSETRSIPSKLINDNSKYLEDMTTITGEQDSTLKEIHLPDVEPALFDAIIQYMVCRNASLGPQPNEMQKFTSIVTFVILANRLKVAGPATTMLPALEAILKQERRGPNPPSILKVGHVNKVFLTFGAGHPIAQLFVRASVRQFLKEQNDTTSIQGGSDDYSEFKTGDVKKYRNKPAHFAWMVNDDFGKALQAKVFETSRNRETRPTFTHSRNNKNVTVYYTDPLDGSQFTTL